MKRTCKQCGKEFELTESELNFYRKKNLAFPKRCAECRKQNRTAKNHAEREKPIVPGNTTVSKSTISQKEPTNILKDNPKPKKNPAVFLIILGVIVIIFVLVLSTGKNGAYLKQIFSPTETESDTNTSHIETESSSHEADTDTLTQSETSAIDSGETESAFSEESDYALTDPIAYTFRNDDLLNSHYQKHGIAMGFSSEKAYEEAASDVVNCPDALHKTEKEDGDDVYYLVDTNEFVIVSTDGYIRTYFNPDDGLEYFNRQ